jgi:hypothetical protein
MRRLAIALVLVSMLLVAAGCGGEDEEAADETPIVETTDETTTDDTTTDETTTDEGTTTDDSIFEGLGSEECLQLASIGAAVGQAFSGVGGAESEESAELLAELVGEAPDEIRADIQIVADALGEYVEQIRDLDLQEGEVPSAQQIQQVQAALASIDQPRLQAASERLAAWADENC